MKLMRKVLPKMLEQESGNIINVVSLGGLYGVEQVPLILHLNLDLLELQKTLLICTAKRY